MYCLALWSNIWSSNYYWTYCFVTTIIRIGLQKFSFQRKMKLHFRLWSCGPREIESFPDCASIRFSNKITKVTEVISKNLKNSYCEWILFIFDFQRVAQRSSIDVLLFVEWCVSVTVERSDLSLCWDRARSKLKWRFEGVEAASVLQSVEFVVEGAHCRCSLKSWRMSSSNRSHSSISCRRVSGRGPFWILPFWRLWSRVPSPLLPLLPLLPLPLIESVQSMRQAFCYYVIISYQTLDVTTHIVFVFDIVRCECYRSRFLISRSSGTGIFICWNIVDLTWNREFFRLG